MVKKLTGRFNVTGLVFFVIFSILLTFIPDISFALSVNEQERDAQEVAQIEKFKENIKREGDTLLLKSRFGSYISLKNSPGCGNPSTCVRYRFVDYFKDVGFYLLQSHYFEGGDHIMISDSGGEKYYVHDLPIFSPDKRRFATVPIDSEDTELNEHRVSIWRIDDDKLISEFSYERTEGSRYRFIRWKDNSRIDLEKRPVGSSEVRQGLEVYVELNKETNRWKMHKTLWTDNPLSISVKETERIALEMERINENKDYVKREGETLLLKTRSGSYISLKNSPGCEGYESCYSYEFVDFFNDIGFYLIDHDYWEGGGVMMISQSDGEIYQISSLPRFSPDMRRLVTVPSDLDTGYYDNGVFVWRIADGTLIQEFSYSPIGYATYEFVKWKDNKSIELKKWLESSKGLCSEYRYMTIPVNLKMEADGWKLYKDFSPDSVDCDSYY